MASSFRRALRKSYVFGRKTNEWPLEIWKRSRTTNIAKVAELFPQRLVLPDHGYTPTLSPSQVTSLLTINETALQNNLVGTQRQSHAIKGYESNQLGSNFPCEDRRSQTQLLETGGAMFAVFDGHGGIACAQTVSERLFDYIAVSLLPHNKLEQYSHAMKTDSPMELLGPHHNISDYTSDGMSLLYRSSLQRFVVETLSTSDLDDVEPDEILAEALKMAFKRMDNDMSVECLPVNGALNLDTLDVGLSGSCACVAHIEHLDIHIANIGDTRAVIGQISDNGEWTAKPMSTDHNTSNEDEVERVRGEHPVSESPFIFKMGRLLGQLIPTRAFGDFRYKWPLRDLKNVVNLWDTAYAHSIIPMNYYTPPYLSNIPEVTKHTLTKNDRFLVIASDGLWDMLDNQQVVQLVGEYIEGKQTKETYILPDRPVKLGNLNRHLQKRAAGLAHKTPDTNAGTHLIRNALGDDHPKVSEMLTLPPEVVRFYRDDITVTVIFFDQNYIRNHTK